MSITNLIGATKNIVSKGYQEKKPTEKREKYQPEKSHPRKIPPEKNHPFLSLNIQLVKKSTYVRSGKNCKLRKDKVNLIYFLQRSLVTTNLRKSCSCRNQPRSFLETTWRYIFAKSFNKEDYIFDILAWSPFNYPFSRCQLFLQLQFFQSKSKKSISYSK